MQQINYGDDKGIDGNDVDRVDGDDDPCHFHFKMSWCVEIQFTVERRQRQSLFYMPGWITVIFSHTENTCLNVIEQDNRFQPAKEQLTLTRVRQSSQRKVSQY